MVPVSAIQQPTACSLAKRDAKIGSRQTERSTPLTETLREPTHRSQRHAYQSSVQNLQLRKPRLFPFSLASFTKFWRRVVGATCANSSKSIRSSPLASPFFITC